MDSRLVGGRYEITEKIGEGGTACIFLAVDRSTDKPVALKIPGEDNRKLYESLEREYLFASTHCHPSLLKPYDIIFDLKKPIIITPFLNGLTIDKFICFLKNKSETAIYYSTIKKLFATILEAARFIHFSGYCYNDFKPSNIIAYGYEDDVAAPEIALIDFNLITAAGDMPGRRGTLHYLAPEVILGHKSTTASDIYSIGVLFYQLLNGTLPFESENESALIENIAETGLVDLNNVPECFRDGLDSMLSRDPHKRPSNMARAAEVLKIDDLFYFLEKSRTEYYLTAGPAPLADDLKKEFDSFRKFSCGKLFVINGYSYSGRSLNFMEAECRIGGIDCLRIYDTDNDNEIDDVLENIISADKTCRSEKILLIEDLESFGNENLRKLSAIVKSRHDVRIAAAAGRWFRPPVKHEIFDPIKYWHRMRITEISFKTFLKRDQADFDLYPLCESTGGDPEQIFFYLKHMGRQKGLEFLKTESGGRKFLTEVKIPENEYLYSRMVDILNDEQRELISMLSAWGNTIPLLMFVNFEKDRYEIVENLTGSGILIRHKDSVSFLSGGLREYIYSRIADSKKREYHKFWALNAGELISNNNERLELTAHHWSLSGDIEQAYNFNVAAAKEFFKYGDYSRAGKFAKMLIESEADNAAGRISALKINGDINRAMGYFKTARKMYVEILIKERGLKTAAEINKELGKLYLLSGNYKKSLYYLKKSLDYFIKLNDDKNLYECNSMMALALWGRKDYLKSLKHFLKTAGNESLSCKNSGSKQLPDLKNDMYNIMSEAQEISKSRKNSLLTVRSHMGLGRHYIKNGDFDKAVGQFKKALEISEKSGNNYDIIESLIDLGSCHFISGDLFMAIECFQNARQAAESSSNIYLKTAAELELTDVSLAMGNYSLALNVLTAIEKDIIYNEDKLLRLKIDLRKARLCLALGDSKTSLLLAERISRSAGIMEKHMLALRAEIVAAESRPEISGKDNIENLKAIFSKAKKQNLTDLVAELQLSLGKYYKDRDNRYNALYYFDDLCEAAAAPKRIKLEAEIHRTEIITEQDDYKTATGKLIETESVAAASGFFPIALQAAELLGALHNGRGRIDLYEECNRRANGYRERLLSALPKGCPAERRRRKLTLASFPGIADTRIVEKTSRKESSTLNVG
ncbi:MAG: serine/threonine protein kinase [Candidatus Zixiibacteriota bacterium]|nr:MAG: serine/threonine protein kinase [candidate division Zixibacteria bacterium]